MSALIELNNISKSYQRDSMEIPVLSNINMEIPDGEFLALMGPSGSGKTTLLNLVGGIDKPTAGSVIIGGKEISKFGESSLAKWRSDNVGFIFQFYNLISFLQT